jgi:hypothetical protein
MIHPACGLMYKMTQARDASEGRRWKSTRCDVPIKERKNPFLVSMPGPILVYKTPMKNFCRKERSLRVDAREKTVLLEVARERWTGTEGRGGIRLLEEETRREAGADY